MSDQSPPADELPHYPHLDTDDLYRLLAEVDLGIGADRSHLPDTPEVRYWRDLLVKEVGAIKAKGGDIDVPHEMTTY